MLQVEHGVALLGVLHILVLSGGIDQGVTPLACSRLTVSRYGLMAVLGRVLAPIVDAAHLTMSDALLRTIVVAFRPLRNLDATRLAVTTEESLRGWVDEVDTVDVHEVVVEAHGQRVGDSHEVALSLGLHLVFLVADVDNDFLGLGRIDAEVGTALLVDLGELVARDGGLSDDGVGRHLNLLDSLRHVSRTLGLEAKVTGNSLAVAAA